MFWGKNNSKNECYRFLTESPDHRLYRTDTHSSPGGGGSAPVRCLPPPIKPTKKKKLFPAQEEGRLTDSTQIYLQFNWVIASVFVVTRFL